MKRAFERWRKSIAASPHGQLWSAMFTIGALNVLVKAGGAIKELVVAERFGTSDALDAFLVAFLVIVFVINTFSASVGEAFLPCWVRIREREGTAAAQQFLGTATTIGVLLLAGLSLLLALFARPLVELLASGFSPQKQAFTCSMLYLILPALLVSGIVATWSPLLNAVSDFATAALAPIITPLLTLILILAFSRDVGVYTLAAGVLAGAVLEAAVMGRRLKRLGFSLRPSWHGLTPAVRKMLEQCGPLVAASFLATGSAVVDQAMAARLGPGSVSVLSFGSKVTALVVGISSVALSNAIYPHFARGVAAADWNGLRATLRLYTKVFFTGMIPVALGLIWISEPLVRLLFQHGSFTAANTHLVSRVQMMLLLQLPFSVAGLVGVRLLSALGRSQVLSWLAALTLVVNIIGDYILMRYWEVPGIALATSGVYVVSFTCVMIAVSKTLRQAEQRAG